MLKHRVFLLRNWEKMREKQELLKREGERERDPGSLSIYTRWGGVIRDDGNIKSGERHRFRFIDYDQPDMTCRVKVGRM